MHSSEEKDSSPLGDTEITRLINVSKELGYKKQDKIPERNLVDFKPTSIMQIATSSDRSDQTKSGWKANQSQEMKQTESKREIQNNLDSSSSQDVNESITKDIKPNQQDIEGQNEIVDSSVNPTKTDLDISDGSPQLDKIDPKDLTKSQESKEAIKEVSSAETKINEKANIISDESNTTDLEEAKREGIEIGKKIALTDLENEQQRIIETFQLIIDNIQNKEAVDKTNLTQSILKTITRLASERAGSIIEDNPAPFKNRIISFVEKIEQESKKLILNLNPRDAILIKKSLVKSLNHKEVEIRENTELFRGDFILQMGSIEIGDLISEQISISEENHEAIMESTTIMTDADKQPDKKIDPNPAKKPTENKNKNEPKGDENGE